MIGIIGVPGDVIAPGAHLLGQRLEVFLAWNQIDGTLENAIDIYTTLLEVGKPYGILVQDEDGLGVTILKRMAKRLDYSRADGRNVIDMAL